MKFRARSPASDLNEDLQDEEQSLSMLGRRTLPSSKIINQWRYATVTGASNNSCVSTTETLRPQNRPKEHHRRTIPETKRSSSSFGFHSPTWGFPAVKHCTEQRTRELLEIEVLHVGCAQTSNSAAGRSSQGNFEVWARASNVWDSVKKVLRSSSVAPKQMNNY
ncbi:Hypothetical protein GLP15_5216 [Giardia lamblia P15]|uniref:Uncharacterized protein n=1 Tax=Giardia intestinalis (strain P15) TaxID=658858 RepID=E1EWE5_GIAIA|nr:Hypothetical protein GLP15_5216 [Giardia lamblia P15]